MADTDVNLAIRARIEALLVAQTQVSAAMAMESFGMQSFGMASFGMNSWGGGEDGDAFTLAATAQGYVRNAGDFTEEGFCVGMEVQPDGFPDDSPGTITYVSPLELMIYGGREIASAAAGRSLSVGLPATRIWTNRKSAVDPWVPYVEGDFMTQPGKFISGHKEGGWREDRGLYVLRFYGISDTGELGIGRYLDALKARFTPHTTFAAGADTVRIRDAEASGSYTQRPSGHALGTLTIQWNTFRQNAILV